MVLEIVGSVLASLGGAAVILFAFAHFLGKVWANRIAEATKAKFKSQFIELEAANDRALENFRFEAAKALDESSQFAQISQRFYQEFFSKRVETYLKLLEIKNRYISNTEEDFLADEMEAWAQIYRSTYDSLRKVVIENQLYISNDLDQVFGEFRTAASEFIREADFVEANDQNAAERPPWENRALEAAHQKFADETGKHMAAVMEQISQDVTKLRSRIEIDKT